MPVVALSDRTVVSVAGPDAEHLLQNIITTDLDALPQGEARPGALLTPQGKILFDFLVSRNGAEGFRLDVRKEIASDFQRRLMLYKLRAKADISIEDQLVVAAAWGDESTASQTDSSASEIDSSWLRDTRFANEPISRVYAAIAPSPSRSARHLSPEGRGTQEGLASTPQNPGSSPLWGEVARRAGEGFANNADAYTTLRIANAVTESGSDYDLSDAFPHDVLLDQLNGIGMRKGCYVGQEVVSRMHHRGTARRRVMIVHGGALLPPKGTELMAGGKSVGTIGSVLGQSGLAIARIDRVKAAVDAGTPITAGDASVTLSIPAWAKFTFPETAEPEQA